MKYIKLMIVAAALSACSGENPFLGDDIAMELLNRNQVKEVEFVTFIYNNDIYYLRNFEETPKRITSSPSQKKTKIRISHDHSRIAYLNDNGSPVIIDTLGNTQSVLSNFSGVKQFDWTGDDDGIYMLIDNDILFSHSNIAIPEMEKDFQEEILSAVLTKNNDIIYIVQRPIGLGRYVQRIEVRKADGKSRTIPMKEGEIRKMRTLRLSRDKGYYTVGYSASIYDDVLVKLEIYNLEQQFPEYTFETDTYLDPVYDEYSKFIVMGLGSGTTEFIPAAFYTVNEVFEEDKSKYKPTFSSGVIYVDWK